MSDKKTNSPEQMAEFFNQRASSYDQHMHDSLRNFDQFYQALCQPISPTDDPISILDIGIGTGNELAFILERVPRALITGIDLSGEMLSQLRRKYQQFLSQLSLKEGSYLEIPLGVDQYDYAVSVMTLHHLLPQVKRGLYRKIYKALIEGGIYLEGDYYVSPERSHQMLAAYRERIRLDGSQAPGQYHIDIPLPIQEEAGLLREAGFSVVELIWEEAEAGILAARK